MAMYKNHRQPPKTWTAWLDGWTLDMQARGMSGQTVESYWYRVTSLAIDCATSPGKVTAEQIQAWIVQTPDATTRAGRRGAINEFYKWAVRMRHVRRNPVDAASRLVREYGRVVCGLRSIQRECAGIVTLSLVCRYLPKYRQTRLTQISDIRHKTSERKPATRTPR